MDELGSCRAYRLSQDELGGLRAHREVGRADRELHPYPPPGFAHEVSAVAIELFWNCTRPQTDTLRVDGLAFNLWSAANVRRLKLSLVGVNAREASVSEISSDAQSFLLGTMRSTPFQLDLKTTGSEVRFDLFYQFQYVEAGRGRRSRTHAQLAPGRGAPFAVCRLWPDPAGPGKQLFQGLGCVF